MADIDEVAGRHRSPAYYLWVAGVDTLFGSIQPPARTYAPAGSYARVVAIIPGKGMQTQRRLDVARGVSAASPVAVHLRTAEPLGEGGVTDPGAVFGRLGPQGATASAKLLTTIARDAVMPVTVDVDANLSGLVYPRLMHIGREAFIASGAAMGPPTTLTLSHRSVMATPPRPHVADSASGSRPVVVTEPVYFRGRRAIIYEASVRVTGGESGWVERWRGHVEREPEFVDDAVVLHVAPLTAVLDKKLGSAGKPVGLSHDYHHFSDGIAVEYDHVQYMLDGEGYRGAVSTLSPAGGGALFAPTADWDGVFNLGTLAPALPSGHPRRGPLRVRGGSVAHDDVMEPVSPHIVGPPAGFNVGVGNPTPAAVPATSANVPSAALNVSVFESHPVTVADTSAGPVTKRWPECLVVATAASWAPGEYRNVGGAWADVTLSLSGGDGPAFRARLVGGANPCRPERAVRLSFTDGGGPLEFAHGVDGYGDRPATTPLVWTTAGHEPRPRSPQRLPPDAFSVADPSETPDERGRFDRNRVYHANGARTLTGNTEREVLLLAGDHHEVRVPIVGPALGWYGRGEKFITVTESAGIPVGGIVTIDIMRGGPANGERIARAEVIKETALTDPDTGAAAGYALELQQRYYEAGSPSQVPSFGDWPGQPPISVVPTLAFEEARAGSIVASLLVSDGGGFLAGAYDRLPFGGGLVEDPADEAGPDIDIRSLIHMADPGASTHFAPSWKRGDTARDVLAGLLLASGYALDIRTDDTGKCQLRAMGVGLPNKADELGVLTEADIAAKPRAKSAVERRIVNVFDFSANYDPLTDEPGISAVIPVEPSVEAFGGGAVMKIALRGVRIDEAAADAHDELRAMWTRLALLLAYPRRVWTVNIRAGLAAELQLGGIYSVTHNALRGSAGVGVTDALARLRSIDEDWWRATARAEFVFYGFAGAGWNVSLRVLGPGAINPATSVVVDFNVYSDVADRITGAAKTDLDGVSAGMTVRVHPAGDEEAWRDLLVLSVTVATQTIEFDPAGPFAGVHALVGPDYGDISPTTYAGAPAMHQELAYIGRVTIS